MADNQLPQPDGSPSAEIPNLKKKDKERKKAGAAWSFGRGAGNAFEGAVGGEGGGIARAAAAAAEGEAEVSGSLVSRVLAAFQNAEGTIFSRIAAALGELTATAAGKMLAAAVVAMMLGAGAIIAAKMLGLGQGQAAGNGSPDLGGIVDNLKIRRDGDASGLDYAKNDGSVSFGKSAPAGQSAPAGKSEPAQAAPKQDLGPGAQAPALDNSNINAAARSGMDHPFGKLSGSLGSAFGGHDVFKSQNYTPFKGKIDGLGKNLLARGSASSRAATARAGGNMYRGRRFGSKMNRALGRLQQMASMNRQLYGGTQAEAPAQAASDQFESQRTQGGTPPSAPAAVDPTTNPGVNPGGAGSGGDGKGSCTGDNMVLQADGSCAPKVPDCAAGTDASGDCNMQQNVAPWENDLKGAVSDLGTGQMLLNIESTLFLTGEIMLILGAILCSNCCTWSLGAVLLWLGAILVAAATVLMGIILGSTVPSIHHHADAIRQLGNTRLADGLDHIADDLKTAALEAAGFGIAGFLSNIQGEEQSLMKDQEKYLSTNMKPPSNSSGTPTGTGTGGTSTEP